MSDSMIGLADVLRARRVLEQNSVPEPYTLFITMAQCRRFGLDPNTPGVYIVDEEET